ncbi:hypothetical protein ACWGI8_18275 [Streptomyces sp. NPDC054841]
MTQQYLVGETSVLLAQLQAATTDPAHVRDVARLRHEAEATPPPALGPVLLRAMALTDELCWHSLDVGDAGAFARQCACGAEMREFCSCAGLLADG